VIYNGVDTERFRLGLDERFRKGTPQFLFVGNLYSHKKVEELILGFKELVKAYPKAHLQVVGDGHMYERLKRFVAKLKLEDHVELVGRVRDCELPYYYASCDVYVTASRWELFGLPLLEAMACGKPVVASSIPPHVELLTKSKAGTTYTEGDIDDLCKKMRKIYEESDRYRSNALHFAKEHDWSLVADRVLKIYTKLVRIQ
jgi:1,2-diacylglycerol 3-alpha-glucosyltransferase